MARKTTTILGLAALEKKLNRLPAVVLTEIKRSMEKVAEDIVQLARSLVPVEEGHLRDSIDWTWGATPVGALTLGKVVKTSLGKQLTLTVYAGNEAAFYARFVEFGTKEAAAQASRPDGRYRRSRLMTKALAAHHATRAQPFFFPAYRAHRKSAQAAIRKATRMAARKVASGG